MPQSRHFSFVFIIWLLLVNWAQQTVADTAAVPAAPSIAAKSYILLDFHSGEVLAEKNADQQLEPASITKIMTAYLVFGAIRRGELALADQVKISEKAWKNPGVRGWMKGSRMFADVNSMVRVEDLLRGLIVQSGNDASMALAEHLAGSEEAFAERMNLAAKQLGMQNSQFKNGTGWPMKGHYSSARDIALLSRALIKDFPDLYKLFSEQTFTYNKIKQPNRNDLLVRDESVDGIKTGFTQSARYCVAISAARNDMRLISVIMGAESDKSRFQASSKLLNYGFRFYETHRLFTAGDVLKEVRIWKGDSDKLKLGLYDDVYITIPRGQYSNLKPLLKIKKSIFAPIQKQDTIGTMQVQLDGQAIYEDSLIALDNVAEGNLLQRFSDHVMYLLQ